MNKFQLWHAQLWALRHEIGHDRYPIPEPEDALAFAVTEAAEALDAWLMQKGTWVRNNPDAKHTDEYREWAQCAMMLMLALGEGYEYKQYPDSFPVDRARIIWKCGHVYMEATVNEVRTRNVEDIILNIDEWCVGLDMHMQQEFQRLREKFLG